MKKKKIIIGGILILLTILIIICLEINANAENTGGTAEQREDEKTFVKTIASTVRLNDVNNLINAEILGDELDRYIGIGKTTVTEKASDTLLITFIETGNQYEINVNTGSIFEEEIQIPSTDYTNPYLPTGFSYVANTNLETGLVIQDSSGNQYVWVEVPKTMEVYPTSGLNITSFADTEYESIENDLHTYTSIYRNGTSYIDEHSGDDTSTGLTSSQYTQLKQKMLKSIYQNGGFYVGRYETGIEGNNRTSSGTPTETPVIQANAYTFCIITCNQAQSLASGMESGEYASSLMFGVQWDLILKYLESKGTTQSELTTNSTTWGNYKDNIWNITNTSGKYATTNSTTYLSLPYEKTAEESIMLTTGASDSFCKQNIYDLAGNVLEWTLEYSYNTSKPCVVRGRWI